MNRLLAMAPVRCDVPHCERAFFALGETRCERCRHIAACVEDVRRQRAAVYWLDWSADRSDRAARTKREHAQRLRQWAR